ncbi:MAG: YCF48-related protein [bacterium]
MIKKVFLTPSVVLASIFLSGCSLLPTAAPKSNTPIGQWSDVFNGTNKIGSLWKTADDGHSFEVKSKIDDKTIISAANILSIAYHPKKEKNIYVSSVENGIFKTEDGGESWIPVAFPPKKIYSFILDRNDPDNRMFASGVVNDWGKIFRTNDGGKNWEEIYTEPGQKITITAMAQHPKEANVIFAGTSAGTIVKSVDAGNTWKNVGNKFEGITSDFAFDSANKMANYLLIYDRNFYYSPDGGITWIDWEKAKLEEVRNMQEQAGKLSASGNRSAGEKLTKKASDLNERNTKNKMPTQIVSVFADPSISGTVYIGTRNGFFKSTDFGKYWYEINIIESAKKFAIRSIAVNYKNPKEIVFVAGKAFYKTLNGGDTWEVTGLNVDRDASFVSFDPFDPKFLFVGLRKFE